MPVSVLAIASFLLFVVIVVLLWIAGTLESGTIRGERNLMMANSLPFLSITEAFDPIYSVLWEVPIAALQLVDSAGTSGVPVANLRPLYEQAAARFPEIYDGCGFLQWIQFLKETQLISWHSDRVALTRAGQAFLRFRFVTDRKCGGMRGQTAHSLEQRG